MGASSYEKVEGSSRNILEAGSGIRMARGWLLRGVVRGHVRSGCASGKGKMTSSG